MTPPLDLRILGRTLLHTALVGLAAGLVGAAFFAALEYAQSFFLEHLAGYTPLRAHGERILGEGLVRSSCVPLVVLILPMAGALLAGHRLPAGARDPRRRRRRDRSTPSIIRVASSAVASSGSRPSLQSSRSGAAAPVAARVPPCRWAARSARPSVSASG